MCQKVLPISKQVKKMVTKPETGFGGFEKENIRHIYCEEQKTNVFGGRHRAVIIEREIRCPDVSSQQHMAESQEVYVWV